MDSIIQHIPLKRAADLAAVVFMELEPVVARAVVCGGIRRGAPKVHDIDIVVEPTFQPTLLDEPLPILQPIFDRVRQLPGEWSKGGDRYLQIRNVLNSGIALELYLCHPPAEWGSLVAIRTGPWQLGRHAVTQMRLRGFQHAQGGVQSLKTGARIPVPDEETFFELAGLPLVPPEERTALAQHLGLMV